MAILWMDGYEMLPFMRPYAYTDVSSSKQYGSIPGRYGGVALEVTNDTSGLAVVPTPGAATVIVQFAFRIRTYLFGSTSSSYRLCALRDSGGTEHVTFNFSSSGQLIARRGSASGTILATSTPAWPTQNEWHFFEAKVTLHDTTGLVQAKIDGQQVINFTGDTKNGGLAAFSEVLVPSNANYSIDDLLVMDTTTAAFNDFVGEHLIYAAVPSGNGAESDFVGSDGNSVDNYQLVDDSSPDVSDYVRSFTVGDRDLYEMSDLGSPPPSVRAVQTLYLARKTDPGARSLRPLLRSSAGTVVAQPDKALGPSFAVVAGDVRTTDAEGAAWLPAEFNATQFGMEVV